MVQKSNIARNTSTLGRRVFAPLFQIMLSVSVAITLLVSSTTASAAPAGPAPVASTLTNPCGNSGASLTGGFATDPCNLTRDNRNLSFAQNYFGGQQVVDYLDNWWTTGLLPALKAMTAQINASRVDQTRQIGAMMDAQSLNRIARNEQKQELASTLRNSPSELSCVAGSNSAPMSESGRVSNALAKGFKQDLGRLSANATGSPSEAGGSAYQKARWDEYCEEFYEPDNNNGVSVCKDPATGLPQTDPGWVVNGDIDIEGFLLRDTIDMENQHESRTAWALLQNLVQPKIKQRLPEGAVDTAAGREWILRQQHIESVRNIAADVIGSIISRHASIPALADMMPAAPLSAPSGSGAPSSLAFALSKLGSTEYRNFRTGVTLCQRFSREAAGGSYVPAESAKAAWNKLQAMGEAQPANFGAVQPGDLVYFTSLSANGSKYGHTGVYSGGGKFISVLSRGIAEMPISSWKGTWLGFARPPGGGGIPPSVANAPLPPRPVGELIREIRIKAGVDTDDIADNPSYNEIMQAMTKERFFDPEYFIRMHDEMGAIKQEQTSVDAYITMQYEDIYRLQEQINALLAARAALKFNSDPKSNQVASSPL